MSHFSDSMSLDSPQTSADTLSTSPRPSHMGNNGAIVTPQGSTAGPRESSTGSVQPNPNDTAFHSIDNGQKTICNGRFIVLTTLGSGATGKVKLGIDTTTGDHVALKVMARKLTSKRQGEQIKREIEAMTTLKHGNVLALKHVEMELQVREALREALREA